MKSIALLERLKFLTNRSLGLFEQIWSYLFELAPETSRPEGRPILFLIGVDEIFFFNGDLRIHEAWLSQRRF